MKLDVSLTGTRKLAKTFRALETKAPLEAARAVNTATKSGRAEFIRTAAGARGETNIKTAAARRRVQMGRRASSDRLTGTFTISGKAVPIHEFTGTLPKTFKRGGRPLRFTEFKGGPKTTIERAFQAELFLSGGWFKRARIRGSDKIHGRLPIRRITGIALSSVWISRISKSRRATTEKIDSVLVREVVRRMDTLVGRGLL